MGETTKRTLEGAAVAGTLGLAQRVHAAGSDLIRIVLVGCGGRGAGAAINALANASHPNVKLVALADAFGRGVENCLRAVGSQQKDKVDVPEERKFVGLDAYRKAIECEAEVVLICSPPGFHPMQFEAAVRSGKHVFCEKPIAVDAPGVRRFLAANDEAKQKHLAVAVGHHLRHELKHKEIIQRIHDGAIGELKFMRAYFNASGIWVRPRQPDQTEMQYQVNNWYFFNWLSGDHIVEQHVHDIDVMNWMKNDHPVKANGMGGRQHRIGPEFGEIYDHHSVEYEYPGGTMGYSFCRHIPGCWNSFSEHAHGTKGRAAIEGHGESELFVDGQPKVRWERGPDGHQLEMDRFFAAILSGESYNEGDYSAMSTMTAILGRMATYSGKTVTWDDAFNSDLDLSPSGYTWDAAPQPKRGEDGLYPCAMPGMARAF